MTPPLLDTLRRALEADPGNDALRLHVADLLLGAGLGPEALTHLGQLVERGALPEERWVPTAELALDHGRLDLAERCLEGAYDAGVVHGVEALARRIAERSGRAAAAPLSTGGGSSPEAVALRPVVGASITFTDVGGLDSVKKDIHRKIILPHQRPGLFQKFRKKVGGGVLLYGPPGCGKTMIARATAGECKLPFFALRTEDVLSKWIGESEQRLHAAFESARAQRPCVLFLDEIDALGFARSRQQSSGLRGLVDQLLQELDSLGTANEGLLLLAATNAPWDLDDALLRPGRFDRMVFIPPPDEVGRTAILEALLAGRPVEGVSAASLAARTDRCSGADLRELVERALDHVIDEVIERGQEGPLRDQHIDLAFEGFRPSTSEWLARARNYIDFANDSGRFDDVATWLKGSNGAAWWRVRRS